MLRGLTTGLLFLFQLSALFLPPEGQPPPLPGLYSQRWGMVSCLIPVGRVRRVCAGKAEILRFPLPGLPEAPSPSCSGRPWRDGNKKTFIQEEKPESPAEPGEKKHKARVTIEGGWSGCRRPLGTRNLMPRPHGLPLSPAPILQEAREGERRPPAWPGSPWSDRRAPLKNVQEPSESGATRATAPAPHFIDGKLRPGETHPALSCPDSQVSSGPLGPRRSHTP